MDQGVIPCPLLVVLDRGYPSRWLMACLTQRAIHFCMRADNLRFAMVKAFLRSGQAEAIVTIMAPDARNCQAYECQRSPTQVRLIRVVTPNSQIHALITSLHAPSWLQPKPKLSQTAIKSIEPTPLLTSIVAYHAGCCYPCLKPRHFPTHFLCSLKTLCVFSKMTQTQDHNTLSPIVNMPINQLVELS